MAPRPFTGSFTQQEPIADDAIAAAIEVMRSGRLHRYKTVGDDLSETALLEAEYAAYQGARYCLAGCFSTQTYKHLNSGEGGLLVSDDAEFMARAIMLSGSYMLYERHGAAPDPLAFADIRLDTPNCSSRMDNLRAAILRPQLAALDGTIERWNARHDVVAGILSGVDGVYLPARPDAEGFVDSSIQFLIPEISPAGARDFITANRALGVELKWFGDNEPVAFTSTHRSWRYAAPRELPKTDVILSGLFDMRLPLTFSREDCAHIGEIIAHCAGSLSLKGAA